MLLILLLISSLSAFSVIIILKFLDKIHYGLDFTITTYECGFEASSSDQLTPIMSFFYLGVSFLIFDLEIVVLLFLVLLLSSVTFFSGLLLTVFLFYLLNSFTVELLDNKMHW